VPRILIAAFLAALSAATPSLVFDDAKVTLLGAPSPDGQWLSLVEAGSLAVRPLPAGESKILAPALGPEFAYFSSISRDSKSVAYAWFNAEGFYELRSVPLAGGEPKTLFRNPEAGFVQPCAWTSDNRHILTLLFRKDNVSQIALIPAAGGPPRVLRSLNWVYPKRMDISPDGQSIVYDSFAPGSTTQRTLYLLSLDGSPERRLLDAPGNHLFPLFTPQGDAVVYLSDEALSLLPLAPEAKPRVLQPGLGRALPLGLTRDGILYYGVRTGSSDVFVAGIADIAKSARRASLQFPGRNLAPSFSPDGNRLAYLSRRGTENFGQESRSVVVRDLSGDAETELAVRMAHIERIAWRADSAALLLSGSDGRGRGGLFQYDFATQQTRPLAAAIGGPYKGFPAASTKDAVFHLDANTVHNSQTGEPIYQGREVKAIAPLGDHLAVLDANAIRIPAIHQEWILEGASDLAASKDALYAVVNGQLLRLARPAKYDLPGNAQPGISISPDGKTVALAAGREREQIWSISLKR
jgi:Tol biopolymer transport system component